MPLPAGRPRRLWARPVTWLGLALAAAIGSGAYAWTTRAPSVDVVVVRRGPLVQRLVTTGRVMAPARIELGSTVLGEVVEVRVQDGARVAEGELLVRLDDTIARAEVAQAKAALGSAHARVGVVGRVTSRLAERTVEERVTGFDRAEREFQRTRQLHAEGALPDAELDAAQATLDVARSQLAAARASLQSTSPGGDEYSATAATATEARAALAVAEARLAATRVEAPTAGVVLERKVEPGDVVQPGAGLLTLLGDGAPRLSAEADEKYLGVVSIGQAATAVADAVPDQPFPARLTYVAPAVDPGRGTVELRFSVPEPPPFLRPELTVSVNLDVARREATVTLPLAAIRDAAGAAPWVLIVVEDHLERRPLRLGIRGDERIEVLEGASEGERVVVATGPVPAAGARVSPREVGGSDG